LGYDRIQHIISTLYPNHTANVTEAPRGSSYNNRIYYVDIIASQPAAVGSTQSILSTVLKVSGHFFNHTKIQNEVISLVLLARHCSNVPAPLPLAWSEDGRTITTFEGSQPDTSSFISSKPSSWILLPRLPGRTLITADLNSPSGHSILSQLASFMYTWRTQIPALPMFGNLRPATAQSPSPQPPPTIPTPPALHENYTVGGFLLAHHYDPFPITSLYKYYEYHIRDQLSRVMTSTCYDDVRCDIVPFVAEFLEFDLWALQCVQSQSPNNSGGAKAIFSHMDFAPRNILVDDDENGGLKVTGVLDWEFAAYVPECDEAINTYVRQRGDWGERHFRMLMKELGKLGCRVPPINGVDAEYTFDKRVWKEVSLLWRMIDAIAPWNVMEQKYTKDELDRELGKAGRVVVECVNELRRLKQKGYVESKGKGKEKERGMNGVGKGDGMDKERVFKKPRPNSMPPPMSPTVKQEPQQQQGVSVGVVESRRRMMRPEEL
jgi:hypothetical protein